MLRSSTPWLVGLLVLVSASGALAQTEEELEEARALFAEGVQATQEERWPDAADRFRRVMRVRATGQVKYNLALALSHTGELTEAATLLREVVDDSELDRSTRRDAQRLLDGIGPRLAHLTVRVEGDEAGLSITMDGAPLGLDRVGAPIDVDPGTHEVALLRGTREVGSRSVTLAEGESGEVSLVATAVPAAAAPAILEEEPTEPAAAAGGSILEDWWFWTIIGVAVAVGAGIGVAVAVSEGGPSPVQGNLSPGILEVVLP